MNIVLTDEIINLLKIIIFLNGKNRVWQDFYRTSQKTA